jgi:hypothetical protein
MMLGLAGIARRGWASLGGRGVVAMGQRKASKAKQSEAQREPRSLGSSGDVRLRHWSMRRMRAIGGRVAACGSRAAVLMHPL